MTNGEKLVKVFPDIELYQKMHGGIQIDFDSVWWNAEYQEPTTKNDLAVDCISRQALLDATVKKNSVWNKITNSGGDNLETIIAKLPSVTPQEPRKGHWIRVSKDKLRCSECDVIHFIAQYPQGKIDWCPNCGADMREVEE